MTLLGVIDPSWWQRTFFGLVGVVAVVVPLALALLIVRTVVLVPRAAGRRWPEGAGWGGLIRVPAELLVDLQRAAEPSQGKDADVADVLVAARAGLAIASLAVVPASAGLVVAQPGLGVFLLPFVLVLDALVVLLGSRLVGDRTRASELLSRDRSADAAVAKIAIACILGLFGGVAVAQWGSASLPAIVEAQARGGVFGVTGWGLPTAWVHPMVFSAAAIGVHLVGLELQPAARVGGARGVMLRIVDELWVVAGVAWLVTCFGGGGSVPWAISVDGVRHVVSALALLAKVALGCVVLVWARVTWPSVSPHQVRGFLVAGSGVAVLSLGATVLLRSLL